jgi:hypothetical protein
MMRRRKQKMALKELTLVTAILENEMKAFCDICNGHH